MSTRNAAEGFLRRLLKTFQGSFKNCCAHFHASFFPDISLSLSWPARLAASIPPCRHVLIGLIYVTVDDALIRGVL